MLLACGQNTTSESSTEEQRSPALQAIDSLTTILNKDQGDAARWAARGAAYFKMQAYDEAIQDYTQAVALDSLNAEYPIDLAEVYLDYGDAFQARLTMDKAAFYHPNDKEVFTRYARLLLILQEHETAMKAAARAKVLAPGDAEVEYTRGLIFLDQNRIPAAQEAFRTATELDAGHVESWSLLGELAVRSGERNALRYFNNALRFNPDHVGALHGAAYQLQTQNQVDSAIAIYERIHTIDPQYPEAYFNKAMLLLERDSINPAANALNMVTRIDPKMGVAYYYLGYIWEQRGDYKQALREYRIAENLMPEDPRVKQARDAAEEKLEQAK